MGSCTEELRGAPSARDLIKLLNGYWELRPVASERDLIIISSHWRIRPDLTRLVTQLGGWIKAAYGVRAWIVSGGRSCERQIELSNEPNSMATTCELSTHVVHPTERPWATGVDIGFDRKMTDQEWRCIGSYAQSIGLRWGGGSPILPSGVPVDAIHFDLGPRSQTG